MMQLLIKYGNIVLTTTTGRPVQYHLCLLLLVRVAGYIANLLDFYSYRIIGKLTDFFQLQEFSQRNLPVDSFSATVTHDTHSSFDGPEKKQVCHEEGGEGQRGARGNNITDSVIISA